MREPVIIGQIVSAIGLVAVFYPPVGEAVVAAGGSEALANALGVLLAFGGAFRARSSVTPNRSV